MPTTVAAGGQISGQVKSAATNLGVGSVQVTFYNSSGANVGGNQSSNQGGQIGNFTSSGLPAGTYYVATTNSNASVNLVNQVYSSGTPKPFNGSNPSSSFILNNGTQVVIPAQLTAQTGINFTLTAGATISGKVTTNNGGTNLQGVQVQLNDSSNNFLGSKTTAADSTFSFTGLIGGATPFFAGRKQRPARQYHRPGVRRRVEQLPIGR